MSILSLVIRKKSTSKDLDFSPLADAVVSQVEAGSVVQVSGDEDADAYAYLTMLNLQTYKV